MLGAEPVHARHGKRQAEKEYPLCACPGPKTEAVGARLTREATLRRCAASILPGGHCLGRSNALYAAPCRAAPNGLVSSLQVSKSINPSAIPTSTVSATGSSWLGRVGERQRQGRRALGSGATAKAGEVSCGRSVHRRVKPFESLKRKTATVQEALGASILPCWTACIV